MAFKLVSKNRIFRCPNGDCGTPEYLSWPIHHFARYIHGHGLFYSAYSQGRWGTVQLDGLFTTKDAYPYIFDVQLGSFGYDYVANKQLMLVSAGYSPGGPVYQMEDDALRWEENQVTVWNGGLLDNPIPKEGMVKLSDRYLYARDFANKVTVYSCPLDRSTDWAVEWQESVATVTRASLMTISRASEAGQFWICCESGTAVLYDVVNKTSVGSLLHNFYDETGTQDGIYASTFVVELGVFVVCRSPSPVGTGDETYIEVYVPEVEPYAISDPVALDAMEKGDASRVQVTLTGRHGEPITDYPVDWTLVYGAGSLSATQTDTDSQGNAEVLYIGVAPTSVQIQAEVTY